MHPREGWSEDGPPRPGLSRRSFLRQSAGAGLLAGGLGPLLAACGMAVVPAVPVVPPPPPQAASSGPRPPSRCRGPITR